MSILAFNHPSTIIAQKIFQETNLHFFRFYLIGLLLLTPSAQAAKTCDEECDWVPGLGLEIVTYNILFEWNHRQWSNGTANQFNTRDLEAALGDFDSTFTYAFEASGCDCKGGKYRRKSYEESLEDFVQKFVSSSSGVDLFETLYLKNGGVKSSKEFLTAVKRSWTQYDESMSSLAKLTTRPDLRNLVAKLAKNLKKTSCSDKLTRYVNKNFKMLMESKSRCTSFFYCTPGEIFAPSTVPFCYMHPDEWLTESLSNLRDAAFEKDRNVASSKSQPISGDLSLSKEAATSFATFIKMTSMSRLDGATAESSIAWRAYEFALDAAARATRSYWWDLKKLKGNAATQNLKKALVAADSAERQVLEQLSKASPHPEIERVRKFVNAFPARTSNCLENYEAEDIENLCSQLIQCRRLRKVPIKLGNLNPIVHYRDSGEEEEGSHGAEDPSGNNYDDQFKERKIRYLSGHTEVAKPGRVSIPYCRGLEKVFGKGDTYGGTSNPLADSTIGVYNP